MSYNNYSVLEEELSNNFASLQWQLLALELSRISIRKQLFENGRFSKKHWTAYIYCLNIGTFKITELGL